MHCLVLGKALLSTKHLKSLDLLTSFEFIFVLFFLELKKRLVKMNVSSLSCGMRPSNVFLFFCVNSISFSASMMQIQLLASQFEMPQNSKKRA